jgi:hypothetical protein
MRSMITRFDDVVGAFGVGKRKGGRSLTLIDPRVQNHFQVVARSRAERLSNDGDKRGRRDDEGTQEFDG